MSRDTGRNPILGEPVATPTTGGRAYSQRDGYRNPLLGDVDVPPFVPHKRLVYQPERPSSRDEPARLRAPAPAPAANAAGSRSDQASRTAGIRIVPRAPSSFTLAPAEPSATDAPSPARPSLERLATMSAQRARLWNAGNPITQDDIPERAASPAPRAALVKAARVSHSATSTAEYDLHPLGRPRAAVDARAARSNLVGGALVASASDGAARAAAAAAAEPAKRPPSAGPLVDPRASERAAYAAAMPAALGTARESASAFHRNRTTMQATNSALIGYEYG